jgi:diguanylate cyclase (GGDEF)-like protein
MRWSRLFIAAFMTIGIACLFWASPLRPSTPSPNLAYALLLLVSSLLTAGTALLLRFLARYIDRQVRELAFHDALTALPNRALLFERLEHALDRTRRRQESLALLFVDVDRFKVINDSLGHAAGDQVLVALARRLYGCLRPSDTLARFGGDEFIILLEDLADLADATTVAQRIMAALATPVAIEGHDFFLSVSIGIAYGHPLLASANDLLREADFALYRAKTEGRSRYIVFNTTMNSNAVDQLDLESDLWRAIERRELRLVYQPEVDLETGEICGVEALLRWGHPERGLLPPATFISMAEENGSLIAIGLWVLEEACLQLRRWQIQYPDRPPITVSVNISARQLEDAEFAEKVARILYETSVDPHDLKLEITESMLINETGAMMDALLGLKEMGVRLAIDDFGTGYSSLSRLRGLPVDTVKIDQSFVSAIDSEGSSLLIIQAIVSLAHDLGLDVTAEGLETGDQLKFLRELGCDRGQGHYLARPLTRDAFELLLASSSSIFAAA